jgi:hypothetical protein
MDHFGFPYLATRVVAPLHHNTLLPSELRDDQLLDIAAAQALANRLPLCLALSNERGFYFEPDGTRSGPLPAPSGGILVTGKLSLSAQGLEAFHELSEEACETLRTRQAALDALVDAGPGGCLMGDLTKGGHTASAEERKRLKGLRANGTPRGLTKCKKCGDWKGVCLDPSPNFAGQVMTVHCLCDNHNRCAGCERTLGERRLNANFYDPDRRTILHVPGFSGLSHECEALHASEPVSLRDLIPLEIWEQAFLEPGLSGGSSFARDAVCAAATLVGVDLNDSPHVDDKEEIVTELLEEHEVGSVGLSFPESMHGDAICVTISRFPGGTAVGRLDSSWARGQVEFVLPNASIEDVTSAAQDAIFGAQDGADWGIFEEGEEIPEDCIPAKFVGFDELEKLWKRKAR